MYRLVYRIVTLRLLLLLLLQLATAMDNPIVELEPVRREIWDTGFSKRDNISADGQVQLLDHETFVWSQYLGKSLLSANLRRERAIPTLECRDRSSQEIGRAHV